VHESEINRLRREIRQLALAIADMRLAYEAADTMRSGYAPSYRVIEAGMVVIYCRAYTEDSKRRQPITLDLLPPDPDARRFHDELFKLRDQVYAHTDETPNRGIVDPFQVHRYTEGYRRWKPESFDKLEHLARSQEKVFRDALTQRERALRKAGIPPDPEAP
jgi:hypothetical protein